MLIALDAEACSGADDTIVPVSITADLAREVPVSASPPIPTPSPISLSRAEGPGVMAEVH